MRVERRAAELKELEHAKLMKKDRNLEASTSRNRAVAVLEVPVDTPAPPWAPSPTNPDSGTAVAEETPRNLPVFTGESPNLGVEIVGIRVSCCLL